MIGQTLGHYRIESKLGESDPHENLYSDPAQAPLTGRLRQELARLRAQYQDSA